MSKSQSLNLDYQLHFQLGDETSCRDGALEKLSTTLLAKLPLYPWHLPHLSIPLTTRTEFFLNDRMRPYSRVQSIKTRAMRAAYSFVTVAATQVTNNQAPEFQWRTGICTRRQTDR
jgi:hypothetical protein